ncbi:hypothetical protein BJX99DRAFT_40320 [Aspergillus californicus]
MDLIPPTSETRPCMVQSALYALVVRYPRPDSVILYGGMTADVGVTGLFLYLITFFAVSRKVDKPSIPIDKSPSILDIPWH